MNVNISVPENVAVALQNKAATRGKDLMSYLEEVAHGPVIQEQSVESHRRLTHDEFQILLREIVALSPGSKGRMDDSREAIYAGCGE